MHWAQAAGCSSLGAFPCSCPWFSCPFSILPRDFEPPTCVPTQLCVICKCVIGISSARTGHNWNRKTSGRALVDTLHFAIEVILSVDTEHVLDSPSSDLIHAVFLLLAYKNVIWDQIKRIPKVKFYILVLDLLFCCRRKLDFFVTQFAPYKSPLPPKLSLSIRYFLNSSSFD